MSFILKALQKLEEENATRPAEPPAIESAILAPPAQKAATRRALAWLAVALVFLAGGAMTYLFFIPKKTVSETPRQEIAVAPITAVPLPSAVPATPPPPAPHSEIPVKPVPVTGEMYPSSATGTPAERKRPRPGGEKPEAAVTAQSPPPAADEPPAVQLAVNGIAFQDDPAASAAVVNGVYVKRGMTVGGARVERIFQDKVRFSSNGRTFEVSLPK